MFNKSSNKNMATTESSAHNIIGNGTVFKGEIESNGDMRIDGKVIGSIKSDGKVVVGENGIVEGEIHCNYIDISGYVKGSMNVEELTSLKSTSQVEVELTTKQLFIEVGAVFTGKCFMSKQDSSKDKSENEKQNSVFSV